MSCATCGCAAQPCDCCEGVGVLTPRAVHNRPGLPTLSYRVGTHSDFFQTMKARLSTMEVDGPGSDGQPLSHLRPLQGLTTRDPSDPSIALLDAWATVGDVLGFYQERYANEAYLRTATERRSVLELARLVGYTLRPGVAASVYMAYTLDDNQLEPVVIPAGTRSQSVPDPDETAQTFETSEDLPARREWNNLQARLRRPQRITLANALAPLESISVAGINTNLKPGDKLLFVFSDDGSLAVVRNVAAIDARFADQRTVISLRAIEPTLLACVDALLAFIATMESLPASEQGNAGYRIVLAQARLQLSQARLGSPLPPADWVQAITSPNTQGVSAAVSAALTALGQAIGAALGASGGTTAVPITSPNEFVNKLLQPPVPQARNSLQLRRSLAQAFLAPTTPRAIDPPEDSTDSPVVNARTEFAASATSAAASAARPVPRPYADAGTQLLVSFAPQVARSYYAAWSGAQLNAARAELVGVHVFRSRATLFGATAARLPAYTDGSGSNGMPKIAGLLLPQNLWTADWSYEADEHANNAFLDQANEAIGPGSYVLADVADQQTVTNAANQGVDKASRRTVMRVARASATPRSAYGLSGPSTQIVFDPVDGAGWRTPGTAQSITAELRRTQLNVQSEALTLVDETLTDPVGEQQIPLDGLYRELTSGRWVILSGERADIDQVSGVKTAELLMISGLVHDFDPTLPGDTIHTTLTLATPPAYRYKRDTLTIHGNVVKATHGETRDEVLGDGDGAQSLRSFTLKQPPLTFVAVPTAAGAQSTLHVRVNDVEWHETESLAWLGPKDRGFITLTDDDGNTSLSFGNGVHGARLPSGVQNVRSVYRNGIGAPGNVKAGQIRLLQSRPPGVKEVVNPLRASGGADKESRDLARENAPLSVMPLDRLVSVRDYADFTRRFAGIAKAIALAASDGRRQLVYLTIAGVDDAPIDVTSDLYANLLDALRRQGDPDLPLRVDTRDLKALVLSANIKLLPDFDWEPVVAAVRAQLLDRFGFNRRALGQPALTCEIIAAMQNVRGVSYVDVDAFGAISQTVVDTTKGPNGQDVHTRRFLTQDDIVAAVAAIVQSPKPQGPKGKTIERLPPDVDAWPGGSDQGLLRPAELAVFMPGVAATLVLNQIP